MKEGLPSSASNISLPEANSQPAMFQQFNPGFENQQNLIPAIFAGAVAAVAGAAAWALITVVTKYQIGWMAVGVGFLVGFAVRFAGKGITAIFGIMGAFLSLFGCLLGNLLSICGFLSLQSSASFMQIMGNLNPDLIGKLLVATFRPMDLLFYGLAVYEGYKFSFRKITQQEPQSVGQKS